MSLLDQARQTQAGTTKGPACSVAYALRHQPDHAAEIVAIIADRDISGGNAEATFRRHGIDISKITVERHRRNQCKTCRVAGRTW